MYTQVFDAIWVIPYTLKEVRLVVHHVTRIVQVLKGLRDVGVHRCMQPTHQVVKKGRFCARLQIAKVLHKLLLVYAVLQNVKDLVKTTVFFVDDLPDWTTHVGGVSFLVVKQID